MSGRSSSSFPCPGRHSVEAPKDHNKIMLFTAIEMHFQRQMNQDWNRNTNFCFCCFRKTNLNEAFVEAEVVPYWVLPTLLVVLVVRELHRDVLVDAWNKIDILKDAKQQTVLKIWCTPCNKLFDQIWCLKFYEFEDA